MKITRTSIMSRKTTTRDLPVTPDMLAAWKQGELIQNVMGHLSISDREFIINGMTDDEWDSIFGDD